MKAFVISTLTFLVGGSTVASATLRICASEVKLATESVSQGATGHIVSLNTTNCPNACGTYKRAFIDVNDKELYAQALAAATKGTQYVVAFEDSYGTAKGGPVNGQYTCKLLAIWKD